MRVQLFIPCFVDQLYPQTAFNTIKVLEKAGCTVSYNPAQTCCGQPAFNAGFWDESRSVCSKFLTDFNLEDPIVAPSASCVGFVRNYYKKLTGHPDFTRAVLALSRNNNTVWLLSPGFHKFIKVYFKTFYRQEIYLQPAPYILKGQYPVEFSHPVYELP